MPEPELLTTELCGLGVPGILSGAEEVQKRATTKIFWAQRTSWETQNSSVFVEQK